MFEKSLKELLEADTTIAGLLSTYEDSPSVFSGIAPAPAEMPYLIIQIGEYSTTNLAARGFDIDLYLYDFSKSVANLRALADRLEIVLDTTEISNDTRFDTIRLFWESGQEVENSDINIKRYLCRLTARAGRKKWAESL